MLEIYSIRRMLDTYPTCWYILYRTQPGMWESIEMKAETEDDARIRLTELLRSMGRLD